MISIVEQMGYSVELLRSPRRTQELADMRKVVANVLVGEGYHPADVAKMMNRNRTSVLAMLRSAWMVEREIERAKGRLNGCKLCHSERNEVQ